MADDTQSVTIGNGRRIFVDPADARGETLVRLGGVVYPRSLQIWNEALGLLDAWDVVADVGANYGEMLAGAQMPTVGRVLAFEPNPVVARFLRRTTGELPWTTEVVEAAVAEAPDGTTTLLVDTRWSGTSHIAEATEGAVALRAADGRFRRTEVSKTNLDESVLTPGLRSACIKVDVEGAEISVLRGARRLIAEVGCVALLLEVLHMAVDDVHDLTHQFDLYLLDLQDNRLARWDGTSALDLGRALHSGRYWHQDAIFVAGSDKGFRSGVSQRGASVATFLAVLDETEESLRIARHDLSLTRQALAAADEERSHLAEAVAVTERRLQELDVALTSNRQETTRLTEELQRESLRARRAEQAVTDVHNSASWRVTAPLRRLARLLKRFRSKH